MNESSQIIDDYLKALPAWQKNNLAVFRTLIHEAEPSITEDWKWHVPVFLLGGKMIFAMSVFKAHTKYNFILNGAHLKDTDHLFNNGFDAKTSRSIDLKEGEIVSSTKLRALIKEAVEQESKQAV